MKIICVVVEDLNALQRLHYMHCMLFHIRKATRDSIILADGTPVKYLTPKQFERWNKGQTYMFLESYIAGKECFYHSDRRISRKELTELFNGNGEVMQQ